VKNITKSRRAISLPRPSFCV